jgi:hemerythrin
MTIDELTALEEDRVGALEAIVWSEKFSVGVPVLDEEHRALIKCFNGFLAAARSADRAGLSEWMERLGEATAAHFSSEESLMAGVDYPDAALHRAEHQAVLDEYVSLIDDWRYKRVSAELLCRFMYRWLLRHMVELDMPLGRALAGGALARRVAVR